MIIILNYSYIIIFEMTHQILKQQDRNQPFLTVLSLILKSIVNSSEEVLPNQTHFDCKGAPKLDVGSYLKRIFRYMNCSQSCLIVALVLLDRIQECHQKFVISKKNIHKLLMTAVIIAVKQTEDQIYVNSYYAKISGFSINELNSLESIFLQMIDYKSFVQPALYREYAQKIDAYIESMQSKSQKSQSDTEIHQNILRKL